MRPIDADFCKELGATCIAKKDEHGNLIAISALDNIPTIYKNEDIEKILDYLKNSGMSPDEKWNWFLANVFASFFNGNISEIDAKSICQKF